MGCNCTKTNAARVVPIDNSRNHSVHNAVEHQKPVLLDGSQRNNEHRVIDKPKDQSVCTTTENSKPVPTDEGLPSIDKSTNSSISTSVNNPMQNYGAILVSDLTTNCVPQRINSGTSNKRPASATSQHKKDNRDSNKFNIENISLIEENVDKFPVTATDQVIRKTNDSTEYLTSTENVPSKRIGSGISNKHSLSSHNNDHHSDILDDDIVSISDKSVTDATINELAAATNDHVKIVDANPDAFNDLFLKQRQDAIDNSSYRTIIKSWHPNSLQQLIEVIQGLSKGKSLIDRHWIIFYWIACNIEYDVVSFLNDNIPAQSAESVFRTKKAVCAGYSYLYKYVCDQLSIKCENVSGYAKGYGFAARGETALLKTDHAWNVVEIEQHWYLVDTTWGTGHLNQQDVFERSLNCFYFFTRPHQMIYDHLPEDDKWQLLREPIKMTQYMQMPQIRSGYFELSLELISPLHQAHLSLVRDRSYALVLIRAPDDVELVGSLTNSDKKKVDGGQQVYYDQRNHLWKCKFAPNQDGVFKATIFGKKRSNAGTYSAVVSFKIEALQIPTPPLSYPHTWQIFHDLNLKVIAPQNCSTITLPHNASYTEILIRAPDDVQLSCAIHFNNVNVSGGSLAQFDHDKKLWQLLFAPGRIGEHELIVFATRDRKSKSKCALSFNLNVTQLQKPMKFPIVYSSLQTIKGRICEPINGVLKKGTTVSIHCVIPGAIDVNLQVDSKWTKAEGYQDPILKRQITVGSKEVTIYAKFEQGSSYQGLIKYSVQ